MTLEMSTTESWFPEVFNAADVQSRGKKGITTFQQKFGNGPEFFVRVPGRVNLIGEHIDYCGYGVFPMAIEQDVFLSCSVIRVEGQPILKLVNTTTSHQDFECRFDEIKKILDSREIGSIPSWYFYFLCGIQGILDHFNLLEEGQTKLVSLQVCLDGVIPPCAGLSSSSAVVCSAALATLLGNKLAMTKADLATLCAKSERYVGTEGGGMDQAIALLGKQGTAQLIEFVPRLHGEKVELPPKAIFVIVNSLVKANKAASASFNTRVAECRLATWILAKASGLDNFFGFSKLKDLQLTLGYSFEEMTTLIKNHLHPEPYKAIKVAEILEVDVNDLGQKPLMNQIPFGLVDFEIYNRAKHVIQEAERVQLFRKACASGNLEKLGSLMTESHWSLSKLYDCSHPYLDKMVTLSEGFSYGARLTGAGWGGCMVALVDECQLESYLDLLKTEYYIAIHSKTELDTNDMFVTQPGPGASAYDAHVTLQN